eukprot:3813380-Rhodomonas_salina.2
MANGGRQETDLGAAPVHLRASRSWVPVPMQKQVTEKCVNIRHLLRFFHHFQHRPQHRRDKATGSIRPSRFHTDAARMQRWLADSWRRGFAFA